MRRVLGPVSLAAAVVVAAVLSGGASGAGANGPAIIDATPTPTSSSAPVPSAAVSPSGADPTAAPTPSSAPTSAGSSDPETPPSGGPVTGSGQPGVDFPGVTMTVTPQRNGDLVISETVWLDDPVRTVLLTPPDLSEAGNQFAAAEPRLSELRMVAEGRLLPLTDTVVSSPRTISLARSASAFTISYTLSDAVVISRPSVAGRALGALRPLVPVSGGELPLTVDVPGSAVLSMSCPDLGAGATNCAAPTGQGYRLSTPVRVDDALLLLQLDLKEAE